MATKTKIKLLSKTEKVEKESEYLEALKEFKVEVNTNSDVYIGRIQYLARKLEKAGTENTHDICKRIMNDLKVEILQGKISAHLIYESLDPKYIDEERSATGRRRWNDYRGGDITQKLYAVLSDWTQLDQETIVSGPIERAVNDSRIYRTRTLQSMNDKKLLLTVQAAAYLAPIMADLHSIGKELVEQRKKTDKLWSP